MQSNLVGQSLDIPFERKATVSSFRALIMMGASHLGQGTTADGPLYEDVEVKERHLRMRGRVAGVVGGIQS